MRGYVCVNYFGNSIGIKIKLCIAMRWKRVDTGGAIFWILRVHSVSNWFVSKEYER